MDPVKRNHPIGIKRKTGSYGCLSFLWSHRDRREAIRKQSNFNKILIISNIKFLHTQTKCAKLQTNCIIADNLQTKILAFSGLFFIFANDSKIIELMAKYKLSLSTKIDVHGNRQVMVRATLSRQNQIRFKSGVWVSPSYFDEATGEIVIPKKGRVNFLAVNEATRQRNQLQTFVNRVDKVCATLQGHGVELTGETVFEALEATKGVGVEDITYYSIRKETEARRRAKGQAEKLQGAETFFEVMALYLQKKELSEARLRAYRVLMRQLWRYESFIRATEKGRESFTLSIEAMDKETVEDFFDYFRNEKELAEDHPALFKQLLTAYPAEATPKHKKATLADRGHNTFVKQMKMFKAFFRWCNENGITKNNPFEGVKIGTEKYGTPFYLYLEERNLIASTDLEKAFEGLNADERATFQALKPLPLAALAVQRDVFVFQCLIGCRVGDLLRLTPSNIVNGAIEYIAEKTKGEKPRTVRVPLNGRALELVEKYQGADGKGRLMPFIWAQDYNQAIKAVLYLCGIVRNVTVINPTTGAEEQRPLWAVASSHMARRTFVGTLYKKVLDPNLGGSLSGHVEGSKAFARYRDIDEETKRNVVNLID